MLRYFYSEVSFGNVFTPFEKDIMGGMPEDIHQVRMVMLLRRAWITRNRDESWQSLIDDEVISIEDIDYQLAMLRTRMNALADSLWKDGKIIRFRLTAVKNDPYLSDSSARVLGTNTLLRDMRNVQHHKCYQAMILILCVMRKRMEDAAEM